MALSKVSGQSIICQVVSRSWHLRSDWLCFLFCAITFTKATVDVKRDLIGASEECDGMDAIPRDVQAIYINLASRPERRTDFERSMAPYFDLFGKCKSWTLSRHEATQAIEQTRASAQAAAVQSHVGALKSSVDSAGMSLVFEDDFMFMIPPHEIAVRLNDAFRRLDGKWDVLLFGDNSFKTKDIDQSIGSGLLAQTQGAHCSEAYLVGPSYREKLLDVVEAQIPFREEPFDVLWVKLQTEENSKWFIFRPRIGKQRASYSDIEKTNTDYAVLTEAKVVVPQFANHSEGRHYSGAKLMRKEKIQINADGHFAR
eukprot:TRINITY_DN45670_c0_g1_i1.p1 TRINITY_DN45670_c0_g1~~TRINITY_DN45670_c0_g1_i1.p1  ORF type:complete len:354 (-),score=36.12 TRINITY_DN45670_c0_g1_i1:60-998(-)